MGANYGGSVGAGAGMSVSGIAGMSAGQSGPAIKYQNGSIVGAGAQTASSGPTSNIMNHKQFSMST